MDELRYHHLSLADRPLAVRMVIEFLGTALLTLVAAGAGVINEYAAGEPVSRSAEVVAPGLLVMSLIYAWGPLSGLHINPAVTLAFAARKDFPVVWVAPYVLAQLGGALAAALFLQALFGHVAAGGTFPIVAPGGVWKSFVMEAVLTMMLVTVILNTATGYRSVGHNAALAVGATIALLGLFASPISGASMNPARSLGPAVVAGRYAGWWVYVLGPVAGAVLAVTIMDVTRGRPTREEREAAEGTEGGAAESSRFGHHPSHGRSR